MAYEVTATRKRPQAFDKLVGQEFVVSTIENAIDSGRIAHAYLFSGPRGVGKTSSARLLAKALNCVHGPTAHPCGVCDSCREITNGSSVDVIEIDGASNTSVNDIRVIKDEVLFPPQSSRYKIYIIDEVHMLSNSAFNALLKTIEEPPEYIIFIFATTELQKVPATIRSRCQQFHFQLIGLEDIKGCLREASQEMGIVADEDALFWIAKEAAGSMRDAYTLFDQVASFSGDHITLSLIRDKLGLVGSDQVASLISTAVQGDRKGALELFSSIIAKGVSVEQCVRDFSEFFRTLLLVKQGIESEELLNIRKEDIPGGLLESLSTDQIEAALRYLMQCYREIRYSLSPRFEVEIFISRLASLTHLATPEELVSKLEALKDDIAKGKATVVKEVRQATLQPPSTAAPPAASPADMQEKTGPFEPTAIAEEGEECVQVETSDAPQEPEAREDYTAFLPDLVRASHDSGIFALGNCMEEVQEARIVDGVLCLYTESAYSHKVLNDNIQATSGIVSAVTGYTGRVNVLRREARQEDHNPLLDKLAKAFRGQIVIEGEENR